MFERYVLKMVIAATCVTALSLTMIILLTQSVRYLELVINSDASMGYFTLMIGLAIPKFLEAILPLSFTIGSIYTVCKLMGDREIVIMHAAGASAFAIAKAFMIFSVIAMTAQFALSGWLAPMAVATLQETRQEVKSHYATLMFREGVFNTLGNGLTVYVEDRQGLNSVSNVMIHDDKGMFTKGKKTTILAKRGLVNLTDEQQQLLVYDGTQYIEDPETGRVMQLDFSEYNLDIPIEEPAIITRWREPEERIFPRLFIDTTTAPNIDVTKNKEFIAEIHRRVSSVLLYPCFTALMVVFLLMGEWRRGGSFGAVIPLSIAIVIVQVGHIILFNEARDHMILNAGLYAISLIPLMVSSYWIYRYHKL